MARCSNGEVELYYEVLGEAGRPLLLLVNGLGGQLIDWDEEMCELFVDEGFTVVRFDNRDVGLSTKFEEFVPDPAAALDALREGGRPDAPYTVEDMAGDAAAVLEAVGGPAHVVGVSMGGMIVQALAIQRPDLVLSLCSIMSTTGASRVGRTSKEAMAALVGPPATTAEEAAEQAVANARVVGSPGFPLEEHRLRRRAVAAFDRCHDPAGQARQLVAVTASPDRTERLGQVKAPTLVVHGEADPLIDPSGGRATAEAIPGSRLEIVPGLGHDRPRPFWPQLVAWVVENARRAGTAGSASRPSRRLNGR